MNEKYKFFTCRPDIFVLLILCIAISLCDGTQSFDAPSNIKIIVQTGRVWTIRFIVCHEKKIHWASKILKNWSPDARGGRAAPSSRRLGDAAKTRNASVGHGGIHLSSALFSMAWIYHDGHFKVSGESRSNKGCCPGIKYPHGGCNFVCMQPIYSFRPSPVTFSWTFLNTHAEITRHIVESSLCCEHRSSRLRSITWWFCGSVVVVNHSRLRHFAHIIQGDTGRRWVSQPGCLPPGSRSSLPDPGWQHQRRWPSTWCENLRPSQGERICQNITSKQSSNSHSALKFGFSSSIQNLG